MHKPQLNIETEAFLKWRWLATWLPFLMLMGFLVVTEFVVFEERQRQIALRQQALFSHTGEIRVLIESELNSSIHLATGMVSYIQAKNGKYDKQEIQAWMQNLQKSETSIRNIAIAPDNRIQLVAPLEGNESAIGLYYPDNPSQWPAVEKIIRERKPTLAGPFELKQGGVGLAYRVPVYLSGDQYWGLVSTVLKAESVFAKAELRAKDLDIAVALIDQETANGNKPAKQIWSTNNFNDNNALSFRIEVPGRDLALQAQYLNTLENQWYLWGLRILGWITGGIVSVLVLRIVRSYRQQKLATIALSESREQFMRAFTTAPQGMALLGMDGKWLRMNPTLLQLLQFEEIDLQQSNSVDLAAELHTERLLQHWRQQDESSLQYEIPLHRKDGTQIDCIISIALVESKKLVQSYWILQVIDISARIAAEARLQDSAEYTQAILDNVADGIMSIDLQGKVKTINPAGLAIWKMPETQFVRESFIDRLQCHERPQIYEQLQHFLEGCALLRPGQIAPLNFETQITDQYGDKIDIEVSITATERKDHVELIVVVRDISARKRLEIMQSEFVSIVSHELRTPLTSIIGSLKLIDGGVFGKLPVGLEKMVRIGLQNGQHLALIINDILDMDKLAAGKMEFTIDDHALDPLIATAMENNQSYAKQYQVHFDYRSDPALSVRCDAQRFQQIMSNLLSNAAKYSKPEGRIDILGEPIEQDGKPFIRISVRDYGDGIPQQYQDKIFKKFSQVDGSNTRKKGGTGLGLSICKEMVQHMGGSVGFESQEGQGSCFYFYLPTIA
ncbi:ATP-binding protein [Undibacterium cyanobacteriorum]|uniref:histidine kinase n=1 Tax=Undibacterium cyanobacteriorum TaxID=3073561 RepID=A0ABY9RDJ5_9BURK|nr:ATP-binding protein [Undibacterium sp. 20NA77.5]WMW79293.1 ATP-binding protein [Undibacterium sp. 20NA77.5]